jgi:thymidylate synthase
LFHFNTEELTWHERLEIAQKKDSKNENMYYRYSDEDFDRAGIPKRRLNCLLYQRSVDTALGKPFNIASYALLTAMIAQTVNMTTGTFTHSMGDTHIYVNLMREPKKLPTLWLNPNVKSLFDFKYDDIKLIGYESHPAIKFDVAV